MKCSFNSSNLLYITNSCVCNNDKKNTIKEEIQVIIDKAITSITR